MTSDLGARRARGAAQGRARILAMAEFGLSSHDVIFSDDRVVKAFVAMRYQEDPVIIALKVPKTLEQLRAALIRKHAKEMAALTGEDRDRVKRDHKFRAGILDRDKRCVVTREDCQAVCDAAHIKPVKLCEGGEYHDLNNGILLDASVHRAFDAGLLTFDAEGYPIWLGDYFNGKIWRIYLNPDQRAFMEGHCRWATTEAAKRG